MQLSTYLRGTLFGLAAISLWSIWPPITRLSVTGDLTAWDLTMLRLAIPGVLLLPIVAKRGLGLDHLGWPGLVLLIAAGGVPYVLLAATGLAYAPAHHQAALNPGCMPIFVALIATIGFGETLSRFQSSGLLLILLGALIIVGWQGPAWQPTLIFGHMLFLAASLLWACFTVILRHGKLEPLHAIAIVTAGSWLFMPIYLGMAGSNLLRADISEVVFQALFQGVVITIVSLILYARALELLGAAAGGAFGALVPALSALFAIPLLGEWPTSSDWVAIALISIGVYLASGGPVSSRSSGEA
ncbi:MAG: DMT family transporter [Hyphomicrobiaceae bacterium]